VTTMRAREKVTTVGRAKPTAYLLHPTDWTNILLARDTQGRFMAMDPVGPFSYPTLWGLPVALCEALSQGVGYVGAFNEVVIFDREAFSVSVSSAHSDFFTRNLLAVLGELRVGMVVRRPSALVKMTALSVGGS